MDTMAAVKKEVDAIGNSDSQGSRINLSAAAVSTPSLQLNSSPNMTLAKKSVDSQFDMSEILLPAHSTFPQSNSFIGQLMKWMDICACMAAEKHAGMSCVTASVDELVIHADPVVGELVIIQSQVNCAFRSSMEVGCKVTSEDLKTGSKKYICTGYFTFVILKEGNSVATEIPPLMAQTEDEMRRLQMAHERRQIRLSRKQTLGQHEVSAGSAEDEHSPNEKRRKCSESATVMTELILPPHANHMGNLFGGQIMNWMEQAALITAMRHSRTEMRVTSIDDIHFLAPVRVGDRLRLMARANRVFGGSMEVGVKVECITLQGKVIHSNTAYFIIETLVAGATIPRVVPESDEEKSSYSRALGRRKIRLERRAIAGESQTIVWSKENKAPLIYRNVKSLLEVNAIKDGWEIVSESDGIRVAYKEMSKSVTALRLDTVINLQPRDVFNVVKSFDRRAEWDLTFKEAQIVEKIDDSNDIVHLVIKTSPTACRDFCLLRSIRYTPSLSQYVISNHSIDYPIVKKIVDSGSNTKEEVSRGQLLASGFVIKKKVRSTAASEVTYIAQTASNTLGLVLADLVGQSNIIRMSFMKLKSFLEEKK